MESSATRDAQKLVVERNRSRCCGALPRLTAGLPLGRLRPARARAASLDPYLEERRIDHLITILHLSSLKNTSHLAPLRSRRYQRQRFLVQLIELGALRAVGLHPQAVRQRCEGMLR